MRPKTSILSFPEEPKPSIYTFLQLTQIHESQNPGLVLVFNHPLSETRHKNDRQIESAKSSSHALSVSAAPKKEQWLAFLS